MWSDDIPSLFVLALLAFWIYEEYFTFNKTILFHASIEGTDTNWTLARLRGILSRRINATSVVRFASHTGMLVQSGSRFYGGMLSFEPAVVFYNSNFVIVRIELMQDSILKVAKCPTAKGYIIVNADEVDAQFIGRKLLFTQK